MKRGLLLLMACFHCSCSKQTPNAPKVFRTCFKAEPATLDPRKNSEVISSRTQLMLFEGLTRLLPEGKIEWGVAESAEISNDGLTYIFHLHPTVWSNGRPVTAYDFEYSWKKVLTPSFGAPSSILFSPIEGALEAIRGEAPAENASIHAIDDKTLEVRLRHPAPYFLSLVSFCPFHPVSKEVDIATPDWMLGDGENLVNNGPYRLKKWRRNERLVLEKNPHYHDLPHVLLDGIEISVIPDEKTAVKMFENGEIDWLDSITEPLALDDLEHLKKEKAIASKPIGGSLFCAFNLDHPVLSNRNIRFALSAAIDREEIVRHASPLSEFAAKRIVPPMLCNGKKGDMIADNQIDQAKERLKKGLAELGVSSLEEIPGWEKVALSYEANDQTRRIAQIIQQTWKERLGLQVPLAELDFKSQLASVQNRAFSIALEFWLVHFNDPSNILDRFKYKSSKKNYPGFENSSYIDLLDRATATVDPTKRLELLEEAEEFFASELPLTPILHRCQAIITSDKITSVDLNPIGNPDYKTIPVRG